MGELVGGWSLWLVLRILRRRRRGWWVVGCWLLVAGHWSPVTGRMLLQMSKGVCVCVCADYVRTTNDNDNDENEVQRRCQ